MIRYILILVFSIFIVSPAYSSLKGGVGYTIPIDYSNLNAVEMAEKADVYFNTVLMQNSDKVDENVTSALNLYTMLANKCPENPLYPTRLGILYDMIGKDRYAKGSFYRAIGINKNLPEPYFYLGEFFFKRQNYRRALKMYLKAYNNGYQDNFATIGRIKQIYIMLGDIESEQKIPEISK